MILKGIGTYIVLIDTLTLITIHINILTPNGEVPFLIPVAIFLAKEVAAEIASQATGGATDFLSVRRLGTKLGKNAAKAV